MLRFVPRGPLNFPAPVSSLADSFGSRTTCGIAKEEKERQRERERESYGGPRFSLMVRRASSPDDPWETPLASPLRRGVFAATALNAAKARECAALASRAREEDNDNDNDNEHEPDSKYYARRCDDEVKVLERAKERERERKRGGGEGY